MAQAMMPLRMLALCAALLAPGLADAQDSLPDPTRPPAAMSAPVAPGAPGAAPAVSAAPQVQSILVSLSPGGRRVAVIDGKTLRQGQRFGESVVETINPTEVVLRKGSRRQVLKLFRPAARVAAV